MRLTVRTNLALRTLMFCAVNDGRVVRKQQVAERCNVSENHLAQVINMLGRKGYVRTIRGRNGGLMLQRPASQISVGDVTRDFEGSVPLAECFAAGHNTCPLAETCRLKDALAQAMEAFYASLDRLTLADLVDCNEGLHAILDVQADFRLCTRTAA